MAAFHLLMAAFMDITLLNERQSPASGNVDRLTRPVGVALVLVHWIIARI